MDLYAVTKYAVTKYDDIYKVNCSTLQKAISLNCTKINYMCLITNSFTFDIQVGMLSLFKCYHQLGTFTLFSISFALCGFKSLNLIWYQRIDFFLI